MRNIEHKAMLIVWDMIINSEKKQVILNKELAYEVKQILTWMFPTKNPLHKCWESGCPCMIEGPCTCVE